MGTATEYVLYVNRSYTDPGAYCKGSSKCMHMLQANEAVKGVVSVQNVDDILAQNIDLPSWLNGTPVLVSLATSTAIKGASAVQQLAALCEERASAQRDAGPPGDGDGDVPDGSGHGVEDVCDESGDEACAGVDTVVSERSKKKVDEATLKAFMEARDRSTKKRNAPGPGAMPAPLPASS